MWDTPPPPTLLCMLCSYVEALIRILKAKLRVMQEEMDRLNGECKDKVGTDLHAISAMFTSLRIVNCVWLGQDDRQI